MKRWMMLFLLALAMLMVCAGAEVEEQAAGYTRYVLLQDGTAMITGYDGLAETLEIPAAVDGHPVSAIGKGAFYGCSSLTSVTIPQGVESIGDYAFESCAALMKVSIPESVASVGENPFVGCTALRYIVVPAQHPALAVVQGVLYARAEQRLICYPAAYVTESFTVPEGTAVIDSLAFYHTKALKEILLPDSVTAIGASAFEGCNALEKVVLPAGLRAVAPRTFAWCSSLKEIVLPETVADVGAEAFLFCRNLTRVTLPDDVQSIGEDAFTWCPKVQIAVQPGTAAAQWASPQGLKVTGK